MVYVGREHLTILELQEEQSSVSFDKLRAVLLERPAHTVYIEVKGILYGIVTATRISRSVHDCVEINTHFIAVDLENQTLDKLEAIPINLPVLDKNGRLLGAYTKYLGDLFCFEHYISLISRPVLSTILKRAGRIVLAEPPAASTERRRIFTMFREILNSCGVEAEIISGTQFTEYCDDAWVLFPDKDYISGIFSTHRIPYYHPPLRLERCTTYCTFLKQHLISSVTVPVLESLQQKGVHILSFGFDVDKSGFLDALCQRLGKKKEEKLEVFLAESFQDVYKDQVFPPPTEVILEDGIPALKDQELPVYHIRQGKRLTAGQPEAYEHSIYTYGPCLVIGAFCADEYTLASQLQRRINLMGLPYRVVNLGALFTSATDVLDIAQIIKTPLRSGDIIIFDKLLRNFENIASVDLSNIFKKNQISDNCFWDYNLRHFNYQGTGFLAGAIYDRLLPVLQQPSGDGELIEKDEDFIQQLYLDRYFSDFTPSAYGTIGSIVMNCNPFTLGHRYLVEEALKTAGYLIIFVVEEDASFFSFQERFAMVCAGTADLPHVKVVPSGEFILTRTSFPEYFVKTADEDIQKNVENDITLFAAKIAPKLNITYRFVGEEPEDEVTNAYNTAMKKILPAYGIRIVEIPRKKNAQQIISASAVRRYLAANDRERLKELVPASTIKILYAQN